MIRPEAARFLNRTLSLPRLFRHKRDGPRGPSLITGFAKSSDAEFQLAHLLNLCRVGNALVTFQRQDLLVDGIQDPFLLREEVLVILEGRCNPVLRTDNCGRRIQIIKRQLGDVAGDFIQEAASCAGVGGQDDLAGLLERNCR